MWEDELPFGFGLQLFESSQGRPIERNIPRVPVLGPGQIQLPALEIDLFPLQAVLLAHPDSGVNRKQEVRMKPGIGLLEQRLLLLIREEAHLVVILGLPFDSCRGIPRDLLVVDPDAEDEREGRLPTVPARRFPVARLGLLGQPADNLLLGDLLGRPVSENRKQFVNFELLSRAE